MIKGIKRWLGHNPLLKIMALIIGIVTWFIASRWVYETVEITVPVELELASGMTLTDLDPSEVVVALEYPRESDDLIEEGRSEIKLVHDLTGAVSPGRINFQLQPKDLSSPARFLVLEIKPSRG